jgi:hypothetical protein
MVGALQSDDTSEGRGWHWRSIYDRIIEHGLTDEDVFLVSANYAQGHDLLQPVDDQSIVEDPIEFAVEATIPRPATDPIRAVARQAEAVVRTGHDLHAAKLRLQGDLESARQEIEALEATARDLRLQQDALLGSTSWRVTAPLRRFGDAAKRSRWR